jgi:hypothetical protein
MSVFTPNNLMCGVKPCPREVKFLNVVKGAFMGGVRQRYLCAHHAAGYEKRNMKEILVKDDSQGELSLD